MMHQDPSKILVRMVFQDPNMMYEDPLGEMFQDPDMMYQDPSKILA